MTARTPDDAIAHAHARFAEGEWRSAFDTLRERVEQDPGDITLRDALAELYRRAGSIDQAGRWGAHDLAALTERECRALRLSLKQFSTPRAVERYLLLPPAAALDVLHALDHPVPVDVPESLREAADGLSSAAGIVSLFLGAPALAIGVVGTIVSAFTRNDAAASWAQCTTVALAFIVVFVCGLLAIAALLRRTWGAAAFRAILLTAGVVVVSQADLTSPLPFG